MKDRDLVLSWLDIGAGLKPGEEFIIPFNSPGEWVRYKKLAQSELTRIKESFQDSIYHSLVVRGASANGYSLRIIKMKHPPTIGYIKKSKENQRILKVLISMRHTRDKQIIYLLSEGVSPKEIEQALGQKITPEEQRILDNFVQ